MATRIARARRRTRGSIAKKRGGLKKRAAGIVATAKALLDTGVLRNSIGSIRELTPTGIAIGTRLPYAAIHQFGGMAGRGRKVTIPARPFLGLSPAGKERILDILRAHIVGG